MKIADDEFLTAEAVLLAYLEHLSSATITMDAILMDVINAGVRADYIDTKLDEIRAELQELGMLIFNTHETLEGKSRAFIQEVNEIDQFIY
ncbi:MAG: hypothetical protein LBR20_03500 [Propionibacteriaceae bacterium]|nr:hypothetical protein [Propionibacteriaceae bacterium]